jgi:hypothetical protein
MQCSADELGGTSGIYGAIDATGNVHGVGTNCRGAYQPGGLAIATQYGRGEVSDRQRLLSAADALVVALEGARHSGELRHIRGDLVRLQHDVERLRRTLEHELPQWPWMPVLSA